jgi:hypothetical protein
LHKVGRVFFLPCRWRISPFSRRSTVAIAGDSRNMTWRWILESLLLLLAVAILPVILGILLDVRLQTFPIITLAVMFLGFNVGIVTIYRRIATIYMQISPPDPQEISNISEESKC